MGSLQGLAARALARHREQADDPNRGWAGSAT